MTSLTNFTRNELQKLGKKAKLKRLSLGISQEEFSSRAGLHRTYISQFELGRRNPTYTTLNKIAEALGITVKELLE